MTTSNIPFPRMHVSLYVKSIARTVEFYNTFFGQEADKVKPGYAKYMLSEPALVISFVENPTAVKPEFGHLGFQLSSKEELDSKLDKARAQGLVSKEEMGTNCCYASQDKYWVSDPDGHQWEVYHFHKDVEFNDPHYAMAGESEACCSPAQVVKAKAEACCEPGAGCC